MTTTRGCDIVVIAASAGGVEALRGPGAEDLWGLRPEEATGRPLAGLDIGLPAGTIVPLPEQTLAGKPAKAEAEVDGTNRRGRPVSMLVQCSRLVGDDGTPQGAIAVINDVSQAAIDADQEQ